MLLELPLSRELLLELLRLEDVRLLLGVALLVDDELLELLLLDEEVEPPP